MKTYTKWVAVARVLQKNVSARASYIREILNWPGGRRDWLDAKTPQVLSICKQLERLGYVERDFTCYATQVVWKLTEAGREFISYLDKNSI